MKSLQNIQKEKTFEEVGMSLRAKNKFNYKEKTKHRRNITAIGII